MTDLSPLTLRDDDAVGVVGSNSTTRSLTVDLVGDSRNRSLNGKTVVIAPHEDDGSVQYALGTVTEITTSNRYHEDRDLRGVIALKGRIGNLTGRADVKTAEIEIQSAFRAREDGRARPIGGALSLAPSTGERVFLANRAVVQALAEQASSDLFYLGTMYRQPDILLPMSVHDFSGPRGASFCGFFGPSGSGKTRLATTYVGSMMRHRNMAFLLVDPQGQFVTNSKMGTELPFDLRALAEAQDRDVQQLFVSHDVRMPEDAELFTGLLADSSFFTSNRMIGANVNGKNAEEIVLAWLEDVETGWSDVDAEELLDRMLDYLIDRVLEGMVAAGEKPRERIATRLQEARDGTTEAGQATRQSLLRTWTPFHTLFAAQNPDGSVRRPMQDIVRSLCDPSTGLAGKRKGRPFYIISMADRPGANSANDAVSRALKRTSTQMIVLNTLFKALEDEGRRTYQDPSKDSANLMVVLDEAARFTSDSTRDPHQREMAERNARYFRELRKYAIGWCLILQEPSALHPSIWKQLQNGFRAFAGGLVGNDLDKVREQITSRGAQNLYQQLAQPSIDNPVYTWVFTGSISSLNASSEPTFMEAFTDPQRWADENRWLPATYNVSDVWVEPRS